MGLLNLSVLDYLFAKNYNLQLLSIFDDFYNMSLSAKNLSFTKVTLMLQGSYPITPLFSVSLAGMYFPKLNGMFLGPSFTWSLTNNLDFSLIVQSFAGQLIKGQPEHINFGFLRLKWNF